MTHLLALALILAQFTIPQRGGVAVPGCGAGGPTTNMVAKFDATSLAPCSGGGVTIWTSGVGINSAVASGSPTCVASVFGSAPGVLFTAADPDYFTLATPIAWGTSITEMVVWKPVTVSANQTFAGDGNNSFIYRVDSSGVQDAVDAGVVDLGTGTATVTAGNIYQENVTYVGSAAPTFRFAKSPDATQGGTTSSISAAITRLGNDNFSEPLNAYVGAIYIFSPSLTTTDIQTWESYLSCTYPGA